MVKEDFLNIVQVQETHSQAEANKFLSQGWKLLNVYTSIFSIEGNDQMNIYVLGKPEES